MKMFKQLLILMTLLFSLSAVSAVTIDVTNYTTNDPNGFTNPNYAFDLFDSTYASSWYVLTPSVIGSLGKTFSSSLYINTVYVKAALDSRDAGANVILLQTYNGATWSNFSTLDSGTGIDLSYDGDVTLDSTVSGVRVQFRKTTTGGGVTSNGDLYSLLFDKDILTYYDTNTFNVDIINRETNSNMYEITYEGNVTNYNASYNHGTLNGYTFNDGTLTNFADTTRIGANLDGDITGGAVWSGNTLIFDGTDDYVDLGSDNPNYNLNNALTIAAWINVDNFASRQSVISKLNSGGTSGYQMAIETNQKLRAWIGTATGSNLYSTNTISSGTLVHVATTFDSSTNNVSLWINGIYESSTTTSGTIVTNSETLQIGDWDNSAGAEFDGSISDVNIYNFALNSSQITALYNNESIDISDDDFNREISFPMNEGSGTKIYDTSDQKGKYRGALSFDGTDDYVEATTGFSLTNSTGVTYAFWIKQIQTSGDYFLFDTLGTTTFGVANRAGSFIKYNLPGCAFKQVNTNILGDSEWHYFLVTQNLSTGNADLYVDDMNTLLGTTACTLTDTSITNLKIGLRQGLTLPFKGEIDEFRVWDVSLNVIEREAEMNSRNPIITPVASYSFEETKGTTTFDTNHLVQGNTTDERWNRAMTFDGTDDYVDVPFTQELNLTSEGTWGGWFKPNTITTQQWFLSTRDSAVTSSGYIAGMTSTGKAYGGAYINGGFRLISGTTTLSTEEFNHIMVTYNGSKVTLYLNGNVEGTPISITGDIKMVNTQLTLGRSEQNLYYIDGSIDDVRIYNTSLSSTEIAELYNRTYRNSTNLVAQYGMEEITNVEVHDRLNALCYNCTTTTQSFNLFDSLYTTYYLDELSGQTSLHTFYVDTINPSLTDTLTTEYNSYDIDLTSYITYSDENSGIDYCNVTFNTSQTTICSNSSFRFATAGNHTYNITVRDMSGNENTSSGVIYVNPNFYVYFEDESSNPVTNFSINGTNYTTMFNGTLFEYGFGTHTFQFIKLGFEPTTFNLTFNNTADINTTFSLVEAKISVTIRDKVTLDIINGTNFTIEVIGEFGILTSTSTGQLNISSVLLPEGEYRIVVSSGSYYSEDVFFNFTNQEVIDVTLYVTHINETNAGTVVISTVDGLGQAIAGSIVQALQWDGSTSSFIRVSEGQTGLDGKVTLNIILEDKIYVFRATKTGITEDSPEYRLLTTDNGKTITITLSSEIGERTYLFRSLLYTITEDSYVGNTSTISFDWTDLTGTSQTVCLNAYRYIGLSETRLSTSCTSGASGTYTQAFVLNTTQNIKIKGEVKIGDGYHTLKTFDYPAESSLPNLISFLKFEFVVIPLLFFLAIAIGIKAEAIQISFILLMVASGWSLYLVPSMITGGIVMFLNFMAALMIWGAIGGRR